MQAQEKLGPVDMLVNCAGTSISGKFEDVEVDRFKVGSRKLNQDTDMVLLMFRRQKAALNF